MVRACHPWNNRIDNLAGVDGTASGVAGEPLGVRSVWWQWKGLDAVVVVAAAAAVAVVVVAGHYLLLEEFSVGVNYEEQG